MIEQRIQLDQRALRLAAGIDAFHRQAQEGVMHVIELKLEEARTLTEELLAELDRGPGAQELAIVRTKIREAEHWVKASQDAIDTATIESREE